MLMTSTGWCDDRRSVVQSSAAHSGRNDNRWYPRLNKPGTAKNQDVQGKSASSNSWKWFRRHGKRTSRWWKRRQGDLVSQVVSFGEVCLKVDVEVDDSCWVRRSWRIGRQRLTSSASPQSTTQEKVRKSDHIDLQGRSASFPGNSLAGGGSVWLEGANPLPTSAGAHVRAAEEAKKRWLD